MIEFKVKLHCDYCHREDKAWLPVQVGERGQSPHLVPRRPLPGAWQTSTGARQRLYCSDKCVAQDRPE